MNESHLCVVDVVDDCLDIVITEHVRELQALSYLKCSCTGFFKNVLRVAGLESLMPK